MNNIAIVSIELSDIPTQKPVLIAGPTASGKSDLALEIAKRHGGVIINADAFQIYDNWQVLTARPPDTDLLKAPHRLYGFLPYDAEYSVGSWLRDISKHLNHDTRPIIVGGTGLYFSALTEGLADIPEIPLKTKDNYEIELRNNGLNGVIEQLDPRTRDRIDLQNPMRVQRAWLVLQQTGQGLAEWQDSTPKPLLALDQCTPILVNADKELLNQRITGRFDTMLKTGALEEAEANLACADRNFQSMKAIGAHELFAYLRNEISLEDAKERATIATRQYAKRQRSWFRSRMKNWIPYSVQGH